MFESPLQFNTHISHYSPMTYCEKKKKKKEAVPSYFKAYCNGLFFVAEEHLSMTVYLFSTYYFALYGLFCDNDHLTVRYALHNV